MKRYLLAAIGVLVMISVAPAMAQEGQPQMPRSNPAELPKVFAVRASVADLERSERFYRDGLGAEIRKLHEREIIVYFKTGLNIVLAQSRASNNTAPTDGAGGFILQVADIEAAIARMEGAGGRVVRPPNSGKGELSYGVRAAFIRDPDGVGIELIQFPAE